MANMTATTSLMAFSWLEVFLVKDLPSDTTDEGAFLVAFLDLVFLTVFLAGIGRITSLSKSH